MYVYIYIHIYIYIYIYIYTYVYKYVRYLQIRYLKCPLVHYVSIIGNHGFSRGFALLWDHRMRVLINVNGGWDYTSIIRRMGWEYMSSLFPYMSLSLWIWTGMQVYVHSAWCTVKKNEPEKKEHVWLLFQIIPMIFPFLFWYDKNLPRKRPSVWRRRNLCCARPDFCFLVVNFRPD